MNDAFALWHRDGDVIVQRPAPPPAHVTDWIERVALREPDGSVDEMAFESAPDFLDVWAMAQIGTTPIRKSADWVGAIVHPRMPVIRACVAPDWVFRWQVVAVLGLVFSEPGWRGTEKREALLSLLGGALDWPLAAAIRVAGELALHESTPPPGAGGARTGPARRRGARSKRRSGTSSVQEPAAVESFGFELVFAPPVK